MTNFFLKFFIEKYILAKDFSNKTPKIIFLLFNLYHHLVSHLDLKIS